MSNHVAPLVSALVSTFNSERFLPGCLTSLEQQTIASQIEIVIIDSGSSENEAKVAMSFAEEFGNVVYERTAERESIYAAWNRALAHARGTYVINANTDDRWRPDAFEILSSRLDERPDVALVYADSAISESPDESFATAPVVGFFRWPEFSVDALFREACIGPHPMWRRSLHERYGAFDSSFEAAGDYEWWLRIARNETLLHVPETLGLYYLSEQTLGRRDPELLGKEIRLARERHWPGDGPMPAYGMDYIDAVGVLAQQRQRQLRELRQWIANLEESRDWHQQQAEAWRQQADSHQQQAEAWRQQADSHQQQTDGWRRQAEASQQQAKVLRAKLDAIEKSLAYRMGRSARRALVTTASTVGRVTRRTGNPSGSS